MQGRVSGPRRSAGPGAVALLVGLVAALTASADWRAADDLVRQVYHEGMPWMAPGGIDDEGVAHLVRLVADPREARVHANALIALGMSQHPDAFAALAAYAEQSDATAGELSRHRLRARAALFEGMGHLSAGDPRALDWLIGRLRPAASAQRSFRGLSAGRLARLEQRRVASALALSGRPEAARALRDALADTASQRRAKADQADADTGVEAEAWRAHLAESLSLNDAVATQGAAAALARDVQREAAR